MIGSRETARAGAAVTNLGPTRVRDVELGLRGDPSGVSVTGSNPRKLGALAPSGWSTAGWQVCGRGPATYVLVAVAVATTATGQPVSAESDARLLRVTGPPACR